MNLNGSIFFLVGNSDELLFLKNIFNDIHSRYSIAYESQIGIVSDKKWLITLLQNNVHAVSQTNKQSFILLITDNFNLDLFSLIQQSLLKGTPVLCFTTNSFNLSGVFTVPNKNPSSEFLIY